MSGRHKFLKQAGALAAVPWSKTALSDHDDSAETVPKLKWLFSENEIHISLDGRQILRSLCSGYQERDTWKNGTELTLIKSQIPYSDRIGRGSAMEIGCKLGLMSGTLLLVEYDDGKLGCRLSVSNHKPTPCILESYSPLMTTRGYGSIQLQGHPAEWRVYVDSGACGGRCASYDLNENEGQSTAGAVSVLWSPAGNESLAIG